MIESLMVPKHQLITFSESCNCQQALNLLEKESLRCAPVLDQSQTLYRGNIYRYHIYQYMYHHPHADLEKMQVTHFLKNTSKIVKVNQSLLELFFNIKDLPFIAVLSPDNSFLGVVPHNHLINYFHQAWILEEAGIILCVETLGKKGDLAKISRIINRHCGFLSAMTLNRNEYISHSAILYQLPKDINILNFQSLLRALTRRKFPFNYWQV